MKTHKIIQSALLVTSLCVVSSSWADQGRFYFGAGVGTTKIDTGISHLTGSAKLDDTDTGYRLMLGYQFTPNIAAEGFYTRYGRASISGNAGDRFQFDGVTYQFLTTATINLDISAVGLGGVFSLPVSNSFDLHVRAGMTSWKADASAAGTVSNENGTDLYYGAGVRYNFNEKTAVSVDYEQSKLSKGLNSASLFSANLIVMY